MVTWWQAALWGLAGGFCVEALELYAHIRQLSGKWNWRHPIPQGMAAFVAKVIIRAGAGALVATAMAAGGQITGPVAGLGFGVAAPLVIAQLARQVPLKFDVQAAMEPQSAPSAPGQNSQLSQAGQVRLPATGGSSMGGGGNAP